MHISAVVSCIVYIQTEFRLAFRSVIMRVTISLNRQLFKGASKSSTLVTQIYSIDFWIYQGFSILFLQIYCIVQLQSNTPMIKSSTKLNYIKLIISSLYEGSLLI